MVDDRTSIVSNEVTGSPPTTYHSTSPRLGPSGSAGSGQLAQASHNNEVISIIEESPVPPLPPGLLAHHLRDMSVSMAKKYGDGDYSVDEAIEYMGLGRYQIIWMCLYGFSSMSQASEVTLSSVILDSLACEWDLTLLQMALIPTLVILAALPGDFIGGYLSDRIGRKLLIIIGQWIIAVSGVCSAFMPTYYTYLGCRMITGFGFGIVTPLVIIQVLEISAVQYRVYGVAINFFMWAIGDIYVDLMAYLLLNDYGWRAVVLAASIPCVIMAFVIMFMDESPKYLLVSNKREEAELILHKMCDMNKVDPLPGTISSIVELQRGDPKEMFTPKYRRRSIAFCIAFYTANAVYFASIYATPNLFSDGYCSESSSSDEDICAFTLSDLISTLEVSLAELLAIPLFAVCCNTFGRIKTAHFLSISETCILFILLWCLGTIVLTLELCALRAFSDSLLLLLYVYAPESYPTYMRSVSFGIIMVCCNLGGATSTMIVYMIGVGYSYTVMFEILICFGVVASVSTFFFENETMDTRLRDNRTIISPSETARVRDFTTPGDTTADPDLASRTDLGSLGSEHFSAISE